MQSERRIRLFKTGATKRCASPRISSCQEMKPLSTKKGVS
jgi:hypothetical protein